MAEQLRMEATVVDKFSGPLKALKDRLGDIKSPEKLKDMSERFEGVHKSVERLTEAVKVGLEPALSGLGVAGLSLAGALAGAAQAARVFSETTNQLRHLSNETSVSVNSIRTLEALFNRLGVGASTTDNALSGFAENLRGIQRGTSTLWGSLHDRDPGFAAQLRGAKDYAEAVQLALSWLKRIRNEQDARSASTELFGTADMARVREMTDEQLIERLKEIRKNQGTIGEEGVKAAEKYEEAIASLREKLTGFRDMIGSDVLPVLTKMVDEVGKFFDANKDAVKGGLISFIDGVKAFDWGDLITRMESTVKGLNEFAQAVGGWQNVFIGLAALKVAETVLPIAASIGTMATNITLLSSALNGLALPKLIQFLGALGINGAALAGAGTAGVVGGLAALIEKSKEAQQPGKGGQFSAATPGTLGADQERLADMQARIADVNSRIEAAKGRSKSPEALAAIVGPLNDEKAEIENQMRLLQQSLKDVQIGAMKEGAEEGLKKATPEAKRTISDWFASIFKSSYDGTGALGGGAAQLIQASYGAGPFGAGGMEIGRDGVMRPRGQSFNAMRGSAQRATNAFESGRDASGGILDMIRKGEVGTLGPEGFKAITKLWHGEQPDVTKMSVDQVLAFQRKMAGAGVSDTAVGGYQINGTTLQDFKGRMRLSGHEMFDSDMQTRIARQIFGSTGGDLGRLRGRWASLNNQSDAALKNAIGSDGGVPGAAEKAVDNAAKLVGMGSSQVAQRLGARMSPGEWCADFVNGALKSANVKGVNSSIANSFLGWGHEVAADAVKRGDVLVENRGRGVGQSGGHVGFATGQTRSVHGRDQIEMLSGNYGNRVYDHDWVDAQRLHVRRQNELDDMASKVGPESGVARRAYPQDWKRAARDYSGMSVGAGGFLGGAQVDPKGSVTVNLHGFPKGVRASTQADGFFKSTKINRGRTMAMPGDEV